jgi:uncharacterized membrane protein
MQPQQELSPHDVVALADRLQWSEAARRRAMELTLVPPAPADWRLFLDRVLLAMGSLGLLFGVLFFVAANWTGLSSWSKFLLLDAGILGGALAAYRLGLEREVGRWSLTVAAGLVGAFLALMGQVYQSGADPYTLFAGWAALITPWAVTAAFGPLWAMWLIVVNVSATLFWQGSTAACWLGLLNAVAWLLAEALKPRLGWTAFPAVLAICWTTFAAWSELVDFRSTGFATPLWFFFTAAGVTVSLRMRSRAKLTAFGLGVVVILTTLLGKAMSWSDTFDFLVLGLAVVGQITALVQLVRRVDETR